MPEDESKLSCDSSFGDKNKTTTKEISMSSLTLAALLVLGNLIVMVAVFWYLHWRNRDLFKDRKLPPVNSQDPFFRDYNGLFNFLDRIPFLRRSGTSNEFDLFKALLLSGAPILAIQLVLLQPSLTVVLLSIGTALAVLNVLLLLHPLLKWLSR